MAPRSPADPAAGAATPAGSSGNGPGGPAAPAAGAPPAVAARGIEKRYGGVTALDGVDFDAAAGEVHALLGENGAGKSTLIKVLTGAVAPDAGALELDGRAVALATRADAERQGIAAVFQELSLVPDLTVAQNVWFQIQPRTPWGTVSARRLRTQTRALLERLGLAGIDPDQPVRDLSLAQRQLVEIARAAARDPRVLILDEATSALSAGEVDWLLALARRLAAAGTAVIFISHRMGEVRRVADRVTIFRNGRRVAVHAMAAVDDETIVEEMLGRTAGRLYPPRDVPPSDEVALEVKGLSDGRHLRGVDLTLRKGEILGIGGLQGQGQPELLASLYGVVRAQGTVAVEGVPVTIRNPRDALGAGLGLALVPEDRQREGLLLPKSIKDNVTLPVLRRASRFGLLDRSAEQRLVDEGTRTLNLVARDYDQPAGSLSGGNQQKVVIAKLLLTRARVLLLHDLVRGVDVGTKAEIFQLMRQLAAEGYAILFYTTDLQELVNVADRVLVMSEGRVAATLEGDAISEEEVLRVALRHEGGETAVATAGGPDAPPAGDGGRVGAAPASDAAAAGLARAARWRPRRSGSALASTAMPYVLLIALVALYAARQSGVLTLDQLNLTSALTLTLVLVAAGQTIVILSGGFDLSVGGIVSLTTVLAATKMGEGGSSMALWLVLLTVGGAVLGALNGLVVTRLRMDPFIVTLATWSIWSGAAALILEIDGGTIPAAMMTFGNGSFLGLATAVWLIVALLALWAVFTRTRLGIEIASVGSSRTAAYLAGVRVNRRLVAAYALSGLFAALAGLFLTTQTSAGSPSGGDEFILTSVAAVVIGGTVLSGGRATMGGTIAAAFILTVIGNVVFSFGLASGWQVILSGALLILAVLVNTIPALLLRHRGGARA